MKKMIACCILLLSLTACVPKYTQNKSPAIIQTIEEGAFTTIYMDVETGVQYFRVSQAGVTPLLNADGTLKIYKYHNEPAQININQPIAPVQNNITITNN